MLFLLGFVLVIILIVLTIWADIHGKQRIKEAVKARKALVAVAKEVVSTADRYLTEIPPELNDAIERLRSAAEDAAEKERKAIHFTND
jgi:hypothetical protein